MCHKIVENKKGIPPYPNLVNLKSNTMKNTMQRYATFTFRPNYFLEKIAVIRFFNTNIRKMQTILDIKILFLHGATENASYFGYPDLAT